MLLLDLKFREYFSSYKSASLSKRFKKHLYPIFLCLAIRLKLWPSYWKFKGFIVLCLIKIFKRELSISLFVSILPFKRIELHLLQDTTWILINLILDTYYIFFYTSLNGLDNWKLYYIPTWRNWALIQLFLLIQALSESWLTWLNSVNQFSLWKDLVKRSFLGKA